MKKIALAMIAALTLSMGVMAQDEQQEQRERRQNNPAEMVQRRTDMAVKKYGLNEEQARQLLELNKKYADKMGPRRGEMGKRRKPEARPDSAATPKPRRERPNVEEMKKNMEEYDNEIQKIFTEEQFKAYKEDMKNRQQRGRGPRQGGGHRGQRSQE